MGAAIELVNHLCGGAISSVWLISWNDFWSRVDYEWPRLHYRYEWKIFVETTPWNVFFLEEIVMSKTAICYLQRWVIEVNKAEMME